MLRQIASRCLTLSAANCSISASASSLTASSSSALLLSSCVPSTSACSTSFSTASSSIRSWRSQLRSPCPSPLPSLRLDRSLSTSTSASDAPKSILGTNAGSGSVLEGAAEQRLNRIKAEHPSEAAAVAAAEHGAHHESSILGQIFRYLGRAIMLSGTAVALTAGYYTYRYDLSEVQTMIQETKAKKENTFVGSQYWVDWMDWYVDTRAYVEKQIKSFRDPTYERLLPDIRPEMKAMGIKTLVLDLNDVLVSKQWTRKKGWTLYKRPGAQEFLFEMGQYFEVVIFTDEPSAYAIPVINKLDKNQVVPYRLYRPETQYHEGKHVRDLSKLNRDLSQVLFISANPDAYMFQPENTLKLKPWKEDASDTTLFDLLPMLQLIALKGVKDVRDVVKSYEGEEDVAKAFKKRMQQVSQSQKQPKQRGLLAFK